MKPAILASIFLLLIAISSAPLALGSENTVDIPPNGLGLLIETPASPINGIYEDTQVA